VAVFGPGDRDDLDGFIARADASMYAAKSARIRPAARA
jgi:GGDEF domain-containing protein